MYADVTTIYCEGESVAKVTGLTVMMNRVLGELTNWCKHKSPVPHSKKCEGMILQIINFSGSLGSLKIGQHHMKWTTYSKLLVVTIDNKLTWSRHISEVKRGFVNKLESY